MVSAELLTGLGAAAAIFFCSVGSAVASAPAGVFALRSSTYRAFIPIVIAGVLAIYGIIVAVILAGNLKNKEAMTESDGYKQLAAGLSVGLACLASGLGMARFLENHMALPQATGHRGGSNEQEQPLVGGSASRSALTFPPPSLSFMAVLTFHEAIGLYGLIVALFLQCA